MRLEVVADPVVGQRDQGHRRGAVQPAAGQLAADDDGRRVAGVEPVAVRQREPVAPGLGERQRRVGGRAGGGELLGEAGGLRLAGRVTGPRRVGVARVGEQVRARGEIANGRAEGRRAVAGRRRRPWGVAAFPGQRGDRVRGSADQVEGVVGGERVEAGGEPGEEARPFGGGAQREVAPAAAAGRVGRLAAAVQQAGDPRCPRVDGQPGAAGLLVDAADQRRSRPVAGRRAPGAASQLVPDAEQAQRNPLAGLKADDNSAHT